MRRGRLVPAVLVALVVAGAAAGMVLAFRRGHDDRLTRAAYLSRATAICKAYGKRLDRIPPPLDPASPGAVYESIGLALPLLREQSAEIRALRPPRALQANVDQFFALTDHSLRQLARARRQAGRRELFPMVQSLGRFGKLRDEAKRYGQVIGFKC
jgi:hypothetical protein